MPQLINKIAVFLFVLFPSVLGAQTDTLSQNYIADSLLNTALEQLGVPYKYATSNPGKSFDCSGFTSYVYGSLGLPCSRSSRDYASLGTPIPLESCQKGDCMVFSGTAPGSTTPGHVGIVVSNEDGQIRFIHCSSSSKHFGVVITDYNTSHYPKRFLEVRRMF